MTAQAATPDAGPFTFTLLYFWVCEFYAFPFLVSLMDTVVSGLFGAPFSLRAAAL
jgi:hypothetical protein